MHLRREDRDRRCVREVGQEGRHRLHHLAVLQHGPDLVERSLHRRTQPTDTAGNRPDVQLRADHISEAAVQQLGAGREAVDEPLLMLGPGLAVQELVHEPAEVEPDPHARPLDPGRPQERRDLAVGLGGMPLMGLLEGHEDVLGVDDEKSLFAASQEAAPAGLVVGPPGGGVGLVPRPPLAAGDHAGRVPLDALGPPGVDDGFKPLHLRSSRFLCPSSRVSCSSSPSPRMLSSMPFSCSR